MRGDIVGENFCCMFVVADYAVESGYSLDYTFHAVHQRADDICIGAIADVEAIVAALGALAPFLASVDAGDFVSRGEKMRNRLRKDGAFAAAEEELHRVETATTSVAACGSAVADCCGISPP